jgi:predicted nucleotidyltransferase
MYGLLQRDLDHLRQTLAAFPQVEQALLFGSRALGNFKKGSDIDLVLAGSELKSALVVQISRKLNEEVPIPYFVDVIDLKAIKNKKLQEHIEQHGVVIYQREDVDSGQSQ